MQPEPRLGKTGHGPHVLFVPGRLRYRKVFRRDASGRVVDFAERREAWDLVSVKSK
jgi:hypothetical protein